MNKLKIYIAVVASTVPLTPAALATDSISTDAARNYFDANWAVINNNSKSHPASTATHADHDMTLEPGED